MIVEVSPSANVVLDGSGNGQVFLGPPTGTQWALRLATLSTSTATKHPIAKLHRGSSSGPLQLVDSTLTGDAASSGKVAGPVFFAGYGVWAVWTGGDPGATATLQVFGQQGGRTDPLLNSPLGEGFPNAIALQAGELDIGVSPNARLTITSNIPAVLTTWGGAHSVTISEVMILYWNATDFKWWATGTFSGLNCTFVGTYDTTNGVYVLERTLDTGAGALEVRIGSYTLNSFPLVYNFQQAAVSIGQGAGVSDSLHVSGDQTITGNLFSQSTGGVTETWHHITGGIGYQNGWGDIGAGTMLGQYRKLASPPNAVQLVGAIQPGVVIDGTTMFTLPVGYRPLTTIAINVVCNKSVSGGEVPSIQITNTGLVQCFGVNVTGINQIQMCTIFPTDV